MPATRFFAMLKAGAKLDWERRNWLLLELCDVAGCALGHAEYTQKLKAVYHGRIVGKPAAQVVHEKTTRPVMDSSDPRTGATLTSIFNGVLNV